MKIFNSDFWVLAGILSIVSGIGIYEGYELNPAFYSQPAILLRFRLFRIQSVLLRLQQ
jgi:hypothetical protein